MVNRKSHYKAPNISSKKKKLNKLKITHRKQKLQINIHQVQNKLFNKLIYISMHNNKYDSNIL